MIRVTRAAPGAMLFYPVEPGQEEKTRLLAEYRHLVRVELPAAAREGGWVLRRDHCFARVILDALCGDCWYAHFSRGRGRSAESQLDVAQLTGALRIGRGMLTDGAAEVARLNAQSLRWRKKG